MNTRIATLRLENHRLVKPGPDRPAELVSRFGGMQAQEYAAAKWAIALRLAGTPKDADIERAFNQGRILRLHVMRPTWHFVAAADAHWMLRLTAPRVQRALAYAYRYHELDADLRVHATKVFERALRDRQYLTRGELAARLARSGVIVEGGRLALLTVNAELERVICSGPRRGTQQTYALLAERAPETPARSRDEELAELTTRYFRSHGPATIRDFAWWSGVTVSDVRRGLEMCKLENATVDGYTYWTAGSSHKPRRQMATRAVHLLPVYDEYFVAYRDLDAVPRNVGIRGTLPQTVVAQGQVAGTWKAVRNGNACRLDVQLRRRLTVRERRALAQTIARYSSFLDRPVSLVARLR